jgi:hypothetical protein
MYELKAAACYFSNNITLPPEHREKRRFPRGDFGCFLDLGG